MGIAILVLDCFTQLIAGLSVKIEITSPANMLFFFDFCFSLMIIFVLTIAISRMSIRIKELVQEIALFEKEMRRENKLQVNYENI